MSFIDFSELIKSHKGVSTSDRQDCGNVIGEREDSVIVERDVMNEHIYVIPKSNIQGYDGARLILNVSEADLKSFEEKRDDNRKSGGDSGESSGIMGAISGTIDKIKDTTMGVKDKVVDTSKDVAGKTKDTTMGVKDKVEHLQRRCRENKRHSDSRFFCIWSGQAI